MEAEEKLLLIQDYKKFEQSIKDLKANEQVINDIINFLDAKYTELEEKYNNCYDVTKQIDLKREGVIINGLIDKLDDFDYAYDTLKDELEIAIIVKE